MSEWWQSFFDKDYLRIAKQAFGQQDSSKQAADIWTMLDLKPACRLLDAPCGWGRLSRPLAEMGAIVLGVDQSDALLGAAENERGELPNEKLRYMQHDFRKPLPESGFDVACNIFTSFGYGSEEDDCALFRMLRGAVRPGGQVLIETNHRDLLNVYLARLGKSAVRLADGTLFFDEPEFDPIEGVVSMHWYWSGPSWSGEKHAFWRCYTPTQLVSMLSQAGLEVTGTYKSLSSTPYGPEPSRIGIVARRPA